MIQSADFLLKINALLNKAKLSSTLSIQNCAHGGNNRTYRVETKEGLFAVKQYFRHVNDPRDRLNSEASFLYYAQEVVPSQVPKIYAEDPVNALALYEYIEGSPVQPNEVTETEMAQAIAFFCALNKREERKQAVNLPLASESCFTIQAHINLINARIIRLQQIIPESDEDRLAEQCIQNLNKYWQSLAKKIKIDHSIALATALIDDQRCISPSDFGFHNALQLTDGTLCFLDFEYAGWDDPAKMVGDFFSQLAIPVPIKFFNDFVSRVMSPFPNSEDLIYRAHLIFPIYQVKWCCIALNIFLSEHLARRTFANPSINVVDMKKNQLKKVKYLFQNLENFTYG